MNFAIIAWYIQYHVNPVHCSSFFVLYFLKFVSVFTTLVVSLSNVCSYVQVKSKLQHPPPPRSTPWAFECLENWCSNSPFLEPNSYSNAPTRGKKPPVFAHGISSFTCTWVNLGCQKRLQFTLHLMSFLCVCPLIDNKN